MTKGEMVELVYLHVTGGQPSQESNVKRIDISFMMAPAVNYVVLKETRIRRKESMMELDGNSTGLDGDFLGTFYEDVIYDDQRGLYYIEPSVDVVPLPYNRGIDTIAPMKGHCEFIKLKDQFEDVGLKYVFKDKTRFWFERVGTSQRIYFKNIPSTIKKVILKAVVSAEDLGEDDQLPLPSGTELEVLELLKAWFTGQKQFPEDLRNDNSDGSSGINIQKQPIKP